MRWCAVVVLRGRRADECKALTKCAQLTAPFLNYATIEKGWLSEGSYRIPSAESSSRHTKRRWIAETERWTDEKSQAL